MDNKRALLLALFCIFTAAASDIGTAQSQIPQTPALPSPVKQSRLRGENENAKGSISGRVVNEIGEPIEGLIVFAVYGKRGANPYQVVQTDLIQTDSEGRFHIPALLPGEYIISVDRAYVEQSDSNSTAEVEGPYYKTEVTYYKDTPDRKDAVPVQVKANRETSAIEITVRRRPLHKVSGTVFGRDGQPVAGARLSMIRKQKPDTPPHSPGVSTIANAQGEWSFEVPDGVYLINTLDVRASFKGGGNVSGNQAASAPGLPMPLMLVPSTVGKQPEGSNWGQTWQVSVSGADVPNVVIEIKGRAQIISGKVVLEDGRPIPSQVTINVGMDGFWDSKVVAADGSFALKSPIGGEKFLSVIIQPFGAYYVKSITCDRTDYLREAFEFGNGVDYKGVQVVLSSRGALVEGQVKINGTTGRDTSGQVVLVPEGETNWRAPLTWFSSAISRDGTFTIYAAPGDYVILADPANEHWFGPNDLDQAEDYVRERASRAQHITLKAGERKFTKL